MVLKLKYWCFEQYGGLADFQSKKLGFPSKYFFGQAKIGNQNKIPSVTRRCQMLSDEICIDLYL
jgi:hypothetical protein